MPKSADQLFSPYLARLWEIPFVEDLRVVDVPGGGADAGPLVVEFRLVDGSERTLLVEMKSSHLPASTAFLRNRLAPNDDLHRWLLAAPHVGAPLGDSLEQEGVNFIDRQGNCHLRFGDQFVARIQGRPPPRAPARSKELRGPGYQVMFALLAEPDLVGGTQREIAAAAGTSRQPVADLLERLEEEALVVRRGRGYAWAEERASELLNRFVAGYRSTLRPKLLFGRFRLPVRDPDQVEAWLDERLEVVHYGGTAGAFRLEPYYRGPLTVAHLGPLSEETRRRIKAAPSDDGDLVWMDHIGEVSARGATPDTVHPLLIYAELMADPDPRANEAAQVIRERWLPWSL